MTSDIDLWQQTTAFHFPPDRERKGVARKIEHRAMAIPHDIHLPTWLSGDDEGEAFSYALALVFGMNSKYGGEDAVLIADGVPPVALLNPWGTAPMRDEVFAEIVIDIKERLYTTKASDNGREKVAQGIKASAAAPTQPIGNACFMHARTVERLGGASVLLEGFDLCWVVDYHGSRHRSLTLTLHFNHAVYHEVSAGNWIRVVESIHRAEDLNTKTIDKIDVIDSDMRKLLMEDWQSGTIPANEYTMTLPDLFRQTMEMRMRDPTEQVAIIEPRTGRRVTYDEMETKATKLSLYIRKTLGEEKCRRLGTDATFGIHLPRCADWYIIMLGVHKAGGAYLSLDPDFPADRLLFALEDSDAVALFTLSSMKGALGYKGGPEIEVDKMWEEVDAVELPEDLADVPKPSTPHSPAYLIYTSGSTGKPKGVLVEHIHACNFVMSERYLFKLGNEHVVIQGFSTSFDASVEEIWLAFGSGSALVVVEKAIMQDAERLQELIHEHQITVFSTVPTLLATMEAELLERIELLIVGGEACNKEVVEMYATGGKRMFVNSYGPTEATVACTADFCDPKRPVTIGRAQPNYVALILDSKRQLLPPGCPGELCIAGPSVARGYVNRPELTRDKFVECTHCDAPEFRRMYHTGDLVRWNIEGRIEFMGRIDSQVKLRGFRIEVGEIENNLATFAGVTTAVVVLRNDTGMPYLAAYLVCEPDLEEDFNEAAFRAHLKKSLPSYMIPTRFVPIRAIPRSPAGKVDRKGFPVPEPPKKDPRAEEANGPVATPSTPTEYLLHDIWSSVFPGQTVSITDNFFEIGGHSLLAGKVASMIRTRGFDGFSIRYLYSHPTIQQLAASLDTMNTLQKKEQVAHALPERYEPSTAYRWFFIVTQFLVMHIVYMLMSAWLFLFLYVYQVYADRLVQFFGEFWQYPIWGATMSLAVLSVGLFYLLIFIPLVKWVLLCGRLEEGVHSVWSLFFLRWWAVRALCGVAPVGAFHGTAWVNLYLRFMGTRLGHGAVVSGTITDYDLVEIGSDTWIGPESALVTSEIVDGMLILRKVKIGKCSSIGARCCIKGGSTIGDECFIDPMSLVHENLAIPHGEQWGGSPAQRIGLSPTLDDMTYGGDISAARAKEFSTQARGNKQQHSSKAINDGDGNASSSLRVSEGVPLLGNDRHRTYSERSGQDAKPPSSAERNHLAVNVPGTATTTSTTSRESSSGNRSCKALRPSALSEVSYALFYLVYSVIISILTGTPMTAIFFFLWAKIQSVPPHQWGWFALIIPAAPFVMAILILYVHLWLIALRWIILPWKVKPGYYRVGGLMHRRKALFDSLMRISLAVAHPMYASIYTQYFLRALGVELGKRVECSNLYGFTPGLTKLGSESFVADFVGVNPPEIFRGVLKLGVVEVKPRAFVGNGSVLPPGSVLNEQSLLGLLSLPRQPLEKGSTYIGSPAFSIPRPTAANAPSDAEAATYRPTCRLYFERCVWEFFRTTTPASCGVIAIVGGFFVCMLVVGNLFDLMNFLKIVSLYVWVVALLAAIMVLVIKWVVVGKEHPSEYPLWSRGVWRAEFVVDCVTVIGGSMFLSMFRLTPVLPFYFRLLGAKIGKNCMLDTIFLTEPDMVTIGDNCCIGDRVTVQTHLFEDRIMKIDRLQIHDRVSVGPLSILLYNTALHTGVTVGGLSLVMKGEAYPERTHWEGVPAQRRGVPAVMAVAPVSVKITVGPPTSRRPPTEKKDPRSKYDTGNLLVIKEWLLDDGTNM